MLNLFHQNFKRLALLSFLFAVVCGNSSAQTNFVKDAHNPVLTPSPIGFDSQFAFDGFVIDENGTCRMWYVGLNGNYSIGEAASLDGVHWTKSTQNPELSPGNPGSYDATGVRVSSVVHDDQGYKMYYYTGSGFNLTIGLATSTDGTHWTKYFSNPVLTTDSVGSWESVGVWNAMVIYESGGYSMWYQGWNGQYSSVGYAISSDGVHWNKYINNPVLLHGTSGTFDEITAGSPRVVKENNRYHMFYGAVSSAYRITSGYALSYDGITWIKSTINPVLSSGPLGWDSYHAGISGVVLKNNTFHAWYSGYGGSVWQIGYATSDYVAAISPHDFTVVLSLNDSGGHNSQLRFGVRQGATDGLDSLFGEEELPPKPPVGNYDVRWIIPGTQGTLRDYRDTLSGTHLANTYTGTVQPGPVGFPISLAWDKTSLPEGTFTLQDELTHGMLYRLNMKATNSFVITDSTHIPFEIIYNGGSTFLANVLGQWNMLSLPVTVVDSRVQNVFPTATSLAYSFDGGYIPNDSVMNGKGYWVKYDVSQTIAVDGARRLTDTVEITPGWNMVGSIGGAVDVGSVEQIPSGIVGPHYYYYGNDGYVVTSQIEPMLAYWVKANQSGKLVLTFAGSSNNATSNSGSAVGSKNLLEELGGLNQLRISDAVGHKQTLYFGSIQSNAGRLNPSRYELPPVPPVGGFDARFANNQFVTLLSSSEKELNSIELNIHALKYPVNIGWKVSSDQGANFGLCNSVSGKTIVHFMKGEGSFSIDNNEANRISLMSAPQEEANNLPEEFALGQNYPNPFNPSTIIPYSLPEKANIKIGVYNLLGQEIASLFNGVQEAGYHYQMWHANVPSGTYYVRFEAVAFGERSMPVLRFGKVSLIK